MDRYTMRSARGLLKKVDNLPSQIDNNIVVSVCDGLMPPGPDARCICKTYFATGQCPIQPPRPPLARRR